MSNSRLANVTKTTFNGNPSFQIPKSGGLVCLKKTWDEKRTRWGGGVLGRASMGGVAAAYLAPVSAGESLVLHSYEELARSKSHRGQTDAPEAPILRPPWSLWLRQASWWWATQTKRWPGWVIWGTHTKFAKKHCEIGLSPMRCISVHTSPRERSS